MNPNPFPSNPSAQTAVLLASFNTPDRNHVDLVLRETNTPRSLYTLARVLRAAQGMDEIEAMHQQLFHDFDGNNHAQLAECYHLTIAEVYASIKASGHAARMRSAATRTNGKCLLGVPARDLAEHLEISGAFAKAA